MKAFVHDVYGSPDRVLRVTDVDKPSVGDSDVLIKVRAAGVDPSVWHLVTGQPYLLRMAGRGLLKPKSRRLGTDVAGQVEAVGRDVTRFRVGDEVFGAAAGSYAEYVCAREASLMLKPPGLSFEQVAAVAVSATTALQGLRDHGNLQPGQKALIIGAGGGVGSFAVQIARAMGAEVTGVCSESKVELVHSLGAQHVIDYTREDFTDGRPKYDVILDTAGCRPFLKLGRALAAGGTLVVVGGEAGGRWLGVVGRMIRGLILSRLVPWKLCFFLARIRTEDLETLNVLLADGNVVPIIDRTYPFAETPAALLYSMQGHARGKVVVRV